MFSREQGGQLVSHCPVQLDQVEAARGLAHLLRSYRQSTQRKHQQLFKLHGKILQQTLFSVNVTSEDSLIKKKVYLIGIITHTQKKTKYI